MDWKAENVIAFFTVILVAITAIYAFLTYLIVRATQHQASIQAKALDVQNQLLHAQMLGQRLELYWKTYAPISDDEIAEVALLPSDWMDPKHFEAKYKNDKNALRRYLWFSRCYEYLAITSTMKDLKLPDPLGYAWTERWARDLAKHQEFIDINAWYRSYYPEFAKFVDGAIGEKGADQSVAAGDAHGSARS